MKRRQFVNWLLAGVPIALVGYMLVYLYIPNSEGFEAAEHAVRQLPDVRLRVGEVREVRVAPFGPFRERFVGSQRHVLLSLQVRGDRGEARIRIWMIRRDKVWTIDSWEFRDR